jgi:SAM-dependent methyltransferase
MATPDLRILEIGCGTANYTAALQPQLGRAWGIDLSEEMLHQARTRSPQALLCQGRAEQLGLQACSFDLLFSVDVIHHIADPLAYYQEAHRVLNRNGQVCTATDSEWIIRHRQPLSTYFPETIVYELGRYPRISDLERLMLSTGFVKITACTTEYAFAITDIQAYRDKAFSALQLIPETAFRRGIVQMERDLLISPIPCKSRYTLLWGTKP